MLHVDDVFFPISHVFRKCIVVVIGASLGDFIDQASGRVVIALGCESSAFVCFSCGEFSEVSWQRKSFFSLMLCVFSPHSQDPAWSRRTFLFLHTYSADLLLSTGWSITKVSVVKHSATPVFKVSVFSCDAAVVSVKCQVWSSGCRRTGLCFVFCFF